MYGQDAYQSSDLAETNYAAVVEAFGCKGIRVERPEELGPALRAAMAEKGRPTLLDVVVTRDPAKMLPAVDNRAVQVRSEEHTSELQSLMRISYAVLCLNKKTPIHDTKK